jgi:hypothetical protein
MTLKLHKNEEEENDGVETMEELEALGDEFSDHEESNATRLGDPWVNGGVCHAGMSDSCIGRSGRDYQKYYMECEYHEDGSKRQNYGDTKSCQADTDCKDFTTRTKVNDKWGGRTKQEDTINRCVSVGVATPLAPEGKHIVGGWDSPLCNPRQNCYNWRGCSSNPGRGELACPKRGDPPRFDGFRVPQNVYWPEPAVEPCPCVYWRWRKAIKDNGGGDKGKNAKATKELLSLFYDCTAREKSAAYAKAKLAWLNREPSCDRAAMNCNIYNRYLNREQKEAAHQYVRWLKCKMGKVPDEDKEKVQLKIPCPDDPEWPAWMDTGAALKELFGGEPEDEDECFKEVAATTARVQKEGSINTRKYCRKFGATVSINEMDLLIEASKAHGKLFKAT